MAERIIDKYKAWEQLCEWRFQKLKANETELNQHFLSLHGIQDIVSPEVSEHDITLRKADLQREIRSLISYAIGCCFGRYSLDHDGLCYAGGNWDSSHYQKFPPVEDNILLICSDADQFENDLLSRLIDFIREVYGAETLEENLHFIAEVLGGHGTSRQIIRSYLLYDFYPDHCKIYHKKPIYWLFSSGRQKSFQALVYYHRWQMGMLSDIHAYLADVQKFYLSQINHTHAHERCRISKKMKELHSYAEMLEHFPLISFLPDDSIRTNYQKLESVLAKIS